MDDTTVTIDVPGHGRWTAPAWRVARSLTNFGPVELMWRSADVYDDPSAAAVWLRGLSIITLAVMDADREHAYS